MSNKRIAAWVSGLLAVFCLAGGGGYYFFKNFTITKQTKTPPPPEHSVVLPGQEDLVSVRIFYPVGSRLETMEKSIPRRSRTFSSAEAVIEEFFRLPINSADSVIPANVRLLGIYRDAGQILYIDLSDEFRRNFHADALSEYQLLRGLYETIVSNIADVQDIKVLIEGKEIDTLGGHMQLRYPLRNLIGLELKAEKNLSDE